MRWESKLSIISLRHDFPTWCSLGPPPLLRSAASSVARGVGTHLFRFLFLRFCFPGDIDEVVTAMACWNNASPVSPYLDDVWFGADEGLVRVRVPRFAGSLQILAVDVSFMESYWLTIGATTSASSSVLFCGMVRFLQPFELVLMDCKTVLHEVMYGECVCKYYFSLLLDQCNFQSSTGGV